MRGQYAGGHQIDKGNCESALPRKGNRVSLKNRLILLHYWICHGILSLNIEEINI